MLVSIDGEECTAKTLLAYTAPLPIVGFSFDLGHQRAIYGPKFEEYFAGLKIEVIKYTGSKPEKLWAGNDITIYELPSPVQIDVERLAGYAELWQYFITLFCNAALDANIKSLVGDTMTLARSTKCDAYLQELQESTKVGANPRKQLLQIEYSHPDGAIRDMYNMLKGIDKNFIGTHHLRDEYKSGIDKDGAVVSMQTGQRVLEGLNKTARFMDVAIRNEKTREGFVSTMTKCGYNPMLEGNPILNADWDGITSMISMSLGGRITFDKRKMDA